MSRKVFLSFLGTGKYKECKYFSHEKGESKVVEYVQDAILELYAKEYKEQDIAYIFLTEGAENKHWSNLEKEIGDYPLKIKAIKNIPEGYSEEEIWKIFDIVFSVIKEDDEIILDVTHGFRSLPMLELVLLNYAKSLKKINVKYILYGAFEALGTAFDIDNRIPDPNERKAPLLDLTSFSTIQAWTFGAESFIQTGNTKTITTLSNENIKPILRDSKGSDYVASNLRTLMNSLVNIETAINTNRGKTINHGNWINATQSALSNLTNDNEQVFSPLKPILKQIILKLANFNLMPHWEASIQWCIDHNLIQQGITQLQEGIISFICQQQKLNPENLTDRDLVSQALNIYDQDKDESEWYPLASENKPKVIEITQSDFVKEHRRNYSKLNTLRNDINHGGYKSDALENGSKFESKLSEIFADFKRIKNITDVSFIKATHSPKLLNLSNHPSPNWPTNQMNAAMQKYGTVEDLPFPQIDPFLSEEDMDLLVDDFKIKIQQKNPTAVHIMGELVFCFKLVTQLKALGISCIASTTKRNVSETNGVKKSVFEFVQFREY